MKLRSAVVLVGLVSGFRPSLVAAHDFWLQPREYWTAPDALFPLTLQVGHGPFRQRSPIPAQRITRFQSIGPDGALVDLRERLRLKQADEDGDLRLESAGAHVLVLQTDDRAQAHLPAIRFNDYLRAEGLTPALEQRNPSTSGVVGGVARLRTPRQSERGAGRGARRLARGARDVRPRDGLAATRAAWRSATG